METNNTQNFKYRKLNPHIREDIYKYLEIQNKLNHFLNSKAKPLTEDQIKWLRIRMGAFELLDDYKGKDKELATRLDEQADEICYFCELNNEVIGFCAICTYHIVDGERPNDAIGIISDIYVDEQYRNGEIAYNLLQYALEELIKANKTSAIMIVQEDNPNRFLHFALADRVLSTDIISRKNKTKTINYELLISDILKIKSLSSRDLARRAIKIKKQFNNGLELVNSYNN